MSFFLFWLQPFVDTKVESYLSKWKMSAAYNCLKNDSEYKQVKGKKPIEKKKSENRFNLCFCSCFVSRLSFRYLYVVDLQFNK